MVYQSEKTLSEMGDKIPASDKATGAGRDRQAEGSPEGHDTDAIKAATEELTQDFYAVSEKLYQQQAPQGGAAGAQPGADAGGARTASIMTRTTRSWTRTQNKKVRGR